MVLRGHGRGGGVVVSRGPRRQTLWIGSADDTAFTGLAAATALLDQSFTGVQVSGFAPFTVTRTVGLLAVRSDQEAALEAGMMALGCMVVREPARVIGVTAIPTPLAENLDDGWFVYQLGGWSGGANEGAPIRTYAFDSKAQRKVSDGDALVWVVENQNAGFACDYQFRFRMLIKVH